MSKTKLQTDAGDGVVKTGVPALADGSMTELAAAPLATDASAPEPGASETATEEAPPEPPKSAYLTTKHSDTFGPVGRFVDLTEAEAKPGLEAEELVVPTADQLALRIY